MVVNEKNRMSCFEWMGAMSGIGACLIVIHNLFGIAYKTGDGILAETGLLFVLFSYVGMLLVEDQRKNCDRAAEFAVAAWTKHLVVVVVAIAYFFVFDRTVISTVYGTENSVKQAVIAMCVDILGMGNVLGSARLLGFSKYILEILFSFFWVKIIRLVTSYFGKILVLGVLVFFSYFVGIDPYSPVVYCSFAAFLAMVYDERLEKRGENRLDKKKCIVLVGLAFIAWCLHFGWDIYYIVDSILLVIGAELLIQLQKKFPKLIKLISNLGRHSLLILLLQEFLNRNQYYAYAVGIKRLAVCALGEIMIVLTAIGIDYVWAIGWRWLRRKELLRIE